MITAVCEVNFSHLRELNFPRCILFSYKINELIFFIRNLLRRKFNVKNMNWISVNKIKIKTYKCNSNWISLDNKLHLKSTKNRWKAKNKLIATVQTLLKCAAMALKSNSIEIFKVRHFKYINKMVNHHQFPRTIDMQTQME